jgi:uncharacterized protein YdeI (YjbR/CyaY-like superfamily)
MASMAKSKMNPKVDAHIREVKKWRDELQKLRTIILDCALTEELKWGKPCFVFQDANLIMIYGLKDSCAIAFFNGALLMDPKHLLIKPGPNTQGGRWIKFANLQEIVEKESILKSYIHESVALEKAGKKVEYKKDPEPVPAELQKKLDKTPALKTAFTALTPGRQRGYILFFNGAKQSQTRESRIDKCTPRILSGKGLNDR